MSGLHQRKTIELERKLGSIDTELECWRRRTQEGSKLEKHHTQVKRIARYLSVLIEGDRELLGTTRGGQLLSGWQAVECSLLQTHSVWDFFREKLAQRLDHAHRSFLRLADELAWLGYRPVQDAYTPVDDQEDAAAAVRVRREPPLLFFDGRTSPFAMTRNRPYRIAGLGVEQGRTVRRLLKSLPIPVIGIPWSQSAHLPETPVIAHETGHAVKHDFNLTETLESLLEQAIDIAEADHPDADDRREAWHSWLGELFADIYGCLCLGPAFVGALFDFLAADHTHFSEKAIEAAPWGAYPTSYLRILVCCQVIETQGLGDEADLRRAELRTLYPKNAMAHFEPEIPFIVTAILEGPFPTMGHRTLPSIISFGRERWDKAKAALQDIALGFVQESDIRVLFATARLAYETAPSTFSAAEALLKRRINAQIAPGTRWMGLVKPPDEADDLAAANALVESLALRSRKSR